MRFLHTIIAVLSAGTLSAAITGVELQGSLPEANDKYSYKSVNAKPFAKALYVKVPEKTKNSWDIQAGIPLNGAIAEGDTIAVVFESRVREGEGVVGIKVQDSAYKSIIWKEAKCGTEWKLQIAADTVKERYQSGELTLALFLGMAKQELQIGGLRIINFGKSAKPADITAESLASAQITVKDEGAAMKAMQMPEAYSKWGNTLDFPTKESALSMRYLNSYDIDKNGFVFIKDGHFHTKAGRIRFLGVNLTFDSMFPEHEQAEKVASHLAGIGVNAVRIHHIDNRNIWGKYRSTYEKFDDVELDKMDYLIAQFKKNGIYVNLNLHVSWNYPSTKDYDYAAVRTATKVNYSKGVDNVMPELIEMQKRYAKDILTHVNPYTMLALKDDPVMAMTEINNENAFFRFTFAYGVLDSLPENFRAVVRQKWLAYLTAKYADLDAAKAAWAKGMPSGERDAVTGVMPFTTDNKWVTEIVNPAHGSMKLAGDTIEVVSKTDDRSSFFQLMKTGLTFVKGEKYTIIFEAKGKKGAVIGVNTMFDRAPWTSLGLYATIPLGADDFREYATGFTARENAEGCGRVTFRGFTGGKEFTIRSVRVEKGAYAESAITTEKSISDMQLPPLGKLGVLPPAFRTDFMTFIRDMEQAYWKDMMAYVKSFNVKVPVTGTQLDYSFVDTAHCYDYVDRHAYWKHPHFPGIPWDGNNYYVENVSMLGSVQNTLTSAIVIDRVKGYPYTSSEYDHPYPNEYCAESAPFMASTAALQDHDGFFFFDFGSTKGSIGYFDYYNNFAKKHLFPFAAAIFRTGKVAPLANDITLTVSVENMFADAVGGKANPFSHLMTPDIITGGRVSIRVGENPRSAMDEVAAKKLSHEKRAQWVCATNDYKQSFFKIDDANAKLLMAFASGNETYEFSGMKLASVSSPGGNFIFSVFNKNGAVGEKGTHIITLASRNRYENVEYLDYTTRAPLPPGDNHGKKVMAKARSKENIEYLECLGATISLELKGASSAVAYTVDNTGMKNADVPVTKRGGGIEFSPARSYESVIYVLEVR
ncbi:MAG: cellulase family glycosylhydrolase [Spirochaetota bacterium]